MLEHDQKSNSLDQNNRRNILKIQGIPANVTDDELEGKGIEIFSCLGIEVKGADIEDCYRLDNANPKNTIVRFVNRKFCYQSLDKKMELYKLGSKKLGFNQVKHFILAKLDFTQSITGLGMQRVEEGLHGSQ